MIQEKAKQLIKEIFTLFLRRSTMKFINVLEMNVSLSKKLLVMK